MDEVRKLQIGGANAAVNVRETVDQAPETTDVAAEMAEQMFAAYNKGSTWTKEIMAGKNGVDIVQSVRLFAQKVQAKKNDDGKPLLNTLELEDVVARSCASLTLPLQHLCRWTVLVRIGVRKLQRDILGMVAMVPMPPCGSVKLSRPADHLGKTHYVLTHVQGDRLVCRGYSMRVTNKGECILGGSAGNKWLKDLWLAPGLQSVSSLVASKRRKLVPSDDSKLCPREEQSVQSICDVQRRKIEKKRKAAGLSSENFGGAHGARLDLENKAIMSAALSCVRALLAQAIAYKEDQLLDEIASRNGHAKHEVINSTRLAGQEEDAFKLHLQRRKNAYTCFSQCGSFAIPHAYMIFSPSTCPKHIPDAEKTELTGITGVAVSFEYLSTRYDAGELRTCPAALPEVEDLSPLVDACGVSTLNGKRVMDFELVQKGDGVAITDYMRYTLKGVKEPREMPHADFLRRTSVRFIPMVVDFQRRRLYPEDLQGNLNGVRFELSHEDVNPRFARCQKAK